LIDVDAGNKFVWTGASSEQCDNWRNPNAKGTIGNSSRTNGEWLVATPIPDAMCLVSQSVYCIQQ
jgi:hypothetical protein